MELTHLLTQLLAMIACSISAPPPPQPTRAPIRRQSPKRLPGFTLYTGHCEAWPYKGCGCSLKICYEMCTAESQCQSFAYDTELETCRMSRRRCEPSARLSKAATPWVTYVKPATVRTFPLVTGYERQPGSCLGGGLRYCARCRTPKTCSMQCSLQTGCRGFLFNIEFKTCRTQREVCGPRDSNFIPIRRWPNVRFYRKIGPNT